jgi:uncharacterized protein YqgC (DUF456 family)
MEITPLAVLGIALMVLALLAIPFGIPGVWIMMAVLFVAVLAREVSWLVFLPLLAVASVAEIAEFLAVDRIGKRYGGSKRTFWGAILGGIVGAVVGIPLPVAGSLAGLLVGTLAGAMLAAYTKHREVGPSMRAGYGAFLGRIVAVGLKVFAGLLIILWGGAALLIR